MQSFLEHPLGTAALYEREVGVQQVSDNIRKVSDRLVGKNRVIFYSYAEAREQACGTQNTIFPESSVVIKKSVALLKSMELQQFKTTEFFSLCSCMVEGFPYVEGKHISPSQSLEETFPAKPIFIKRPPWKVEKLSHN